MAAVLVVAVALRVWGIGYGLPWLFYHHDEPQIVLRALRFGTGDFNPHNFQWPGMPLLYLAFLSYAGWFAVGRLAGWWAGREGFAASYFQDPSAFYLLARVQTVAFGAWTVVLAHGLGRAAYGVPVGIAAALGLALNALHAHYSHFAHPVTAVTAFTVLGLWAAVRLAHDGGRRDLAIGAIALGAGTSTQYHAVLLAVPLGLAVAMRAASEPGARVRWFARGALLALGGLAGFLALTPYALLDFASFRADIAWITAKAEGVQLGFRVDPLANLGRFLAVGITQAYGVPLAIAVTAGAAFALLRRTRADLLLLAYEAAYFVLASRATLTNDRYVLPQMVPGLLLAARMVAEGAARWLPPAARWNAARAAAPALAIGLLSAPTALELVRTNVTMTRGDTRVDALRWCEANVPADSRVVLDMQKFWNTATAPLAENRARIEERVAEIRGGLRGGGHGRAYLEYYRYRLEHPHAPAYYLRGTEMGLAARSLDEYRRAGFEWFLVSGQAAGMMRGRPAPPDSSGPAYYRAVERELELAATFRPERWRRLGPEIRVYRARPAGVPGDRPSPQPATAPSSPGAARPKPGP